MTRLVSVILALTFVALAAGSPARPYVEQLDLRLRPAADSIVAAPFTPIYCYDGENARAIPGSPSRWRAVSGDFCNYDGLRRYSRKHFTAKLRDYESGLGLDYFGARYYAGAMGRYTTPDWSETPQPVPYADFNDPQTLNLYTYARNSPLILTDPDGHCPWCIGAFIRGVGGAAASYISQKLANPGGEVDWRKVGAAGLGGAVAGGTLGIATAPGAILTLEGTTVLATGTGIRVGAAAVSGVAGGVVQRGAESGDLNQALGTPEDILADATVGAVTEGVSIKVAEPVTKATTTAGRVVRLNEARAARGTKTPYSFEVRKAQLKRQQQLAGGTVGTAVSTSNTVRSTERKREEEELRRLQEQ